MTAFQKLSTCGLPEPLASANHREPPLGDFWESGHPVPGSRRNHASRVGHFRYRRGPVCHDYFNFDTIGSGALRSVNIGESEIHCPSRENRSPRVLKGSVYFDGAIPSHDTAPTHQHCGDRPMVVELERKRVVALVLIETGIADSEDNLEGGRWLASKIWWLRRLSWAAVSAILWATSAYHRTATKDAARKPTYNPQAHALAAGLALYVPIPAITPKRIPDAKAVMIHR